MKKLIWESTSTARELLLLRESHRSKITKELPRSSYAHKLYDIVTEFPIISIAGVSKKYEIPFPTVQRTAESLSKIGIVDVTKDKQITTIRFTQCLEILKRGT